MTEALGASTEGTCHSQEELVSQRKILQCYQMTLPEKLILQEILGAETMTDRGMSQPYCLVVHITWFLFKPYPHVRTQKVDCGMY